MSNSDHQDLLRVGETIKQWWERNGLDHEAARSKRKETYIQQKLETMKVYNANTTKDQNRV